MPVIRLPDPVFRRLQAVAAPLVDTPAAVVARLLDFYESHAAATADAETPADSPAPLDSSAAYETYENRNNPHVTIHRVGCSQLRKRGGVHRHGQGMYRAHRTLVDAERYAAGTGLRVGHCKYCAPEK
jgi:hypothetical protein